MEWGGLDERQFRWQVNGRGGQGLARCPFLRGVRRRSRPPPPLPSRTTRRHVDLRTAHHQAAAEGLRAVRRGPPRLLHRAALGRVQRRFPRRRGHHLGGVYCLLPQLRPGNHPAHLPAGAVSVLHLPDRHPRAGAPARGPADLRGVPLPAHAAVPGGGTARHRLHVRVQRVGGAQDKRGGGALRERIPARQPKERPDERDSPPKRPQ